MTACLYYEAVVINGHKLGVLKQQKAALSPSGGRKSKLEVLAERAPSGGAEEAVPLPSRGRLAMQPAPCVCVSVCKLLSPCEEPVAG